MTPDELNEAIARVGEIDLGLGPSDAEQTAPAQQTESGAQLLVGGWELVDAGITDEGVRHFTQLGEDLGVVEEGVANVVADDFMTITFNLDGAGRVLHEFYQTGSRHEYIVDFTWEANSANIYISSDGWRTGWFSYRLSNNRLVLDSVFFGDGIYSVFERTQTGAQSAPPAMTNQPDAAQTVGSQSRVVAIAAGGNHTVGLRADGTVVATGSNSHGQLDVDGWRDIIVVAAGNTHSVGLRTDGTVVAVGSSPSQQDIANWRDIVAVSASGSRTYGIRSDGSVVTTGVGSNVLDGWRDIVDVTADTIGQWSLGLRADGTVVRDNPHSRGFARNDPAGWRNISAVSASSTHVVGLRTDGTLELDLDDTNIAHRDALSWRNVTAVYAGNHLTVGLRADGTVTVVATGNPLAGLATAQTWNDIVAISASSRHIVGLASDGTVVSTWNDSEHNVSGW